MNRFFSLTTRLAVFFTIAAAAGVLGLGASFLVAIERHFLSLDQVALQDKRELVESILSNASSTEDIKSRLREALSNHHGLFVILKDMKGEVIFRTERFLPSASVKAPTSGDRAVAIQNWQERSGEFRSIQFFFEPRDNTRPELDVRIAIDLAQHKQFISELQRTLTLYALLATFVSGLLGWFAAFRGMAPLRTMKNRATAVSSQHLDERMPIEAVPVEMADLARELNRMLDRLQNDFQRLSEFSSDLAHELRTPISNLLTQTQVALATKRDADTYRDILASNAEEFQRLARMVSDMLFLAKTEHGVDLPNKVRFSAAQEVLALLEFYEAVADERKVTLRQFGDGNILGDRLMFRRAVSNLLSNALRHTNDRGEVTIDIRETDSGTQVTVENTGDDVDPQSLSRLFDRFYRADPSRARPESDGAGLGLSITRAIVQAHGGGVEAESAGGRTRFRLKFPGS